MNEKTTEAATDNKHVQPLVSCHRCKGTGKVDAETNELDLLLESFNDHGHNEVDSIVRGALYMGHVRKGQRKHIERIIRRVIDGIKSRSN